MHLPFLFFPSSFSHLLDNAITDCLLPLSTSASLTPNFGDILPTELQALLTISNHALFGVSVLPFALELHSGLIFYYQSLLTESLKLKKDLKDQAQAQLIPIDHVLKFHISMVFKHLQASSFFMHHHKFLLILILVMQFTNSNNYNSMKTRIYSCWLLAVSLVKCKICSSVQNCCFNAFFFFLDKVWLNLGRSCIKQISHPQDNYQIKYPMANSTPGGFWEFDRLPYDSFLGHSEALGYSKKNNQHHYIFHWSEGSLCGSRKAVPLLFYGLKQILMWGKDEFHHPFDVAPNPLRESRDSSGADHQNMSSLLMTALLSNSSTAQQEETKPLSTLQNPTWGQ